MFLSMAEFSSSNNVEETIQVQPYICRADMVLKDNDVIAWRGHTIEVIETPGHTISSVCYLLDNTWLFSGDTLFANVETNTRFPSGSKEDFRNITLKKLENLPKDITVYPGHFERFRLDERLANIYD
jgi:hydroxyacylglutathione hydrolase